MKPLLILLFALCALPAFSQEYPFERKFMAGTIMLKDSSQKTGQIKWFVSPSVKLQFRENEDADMDKYSPDELLGFTSVGFKFVALFNFKGLHLRLCPVG